MAIQKYRIWAAFLALAGLCAFFTNCAPTSFASTGSASGASLAASPSNPDAGDSNAGRSPASDSPQALCADFASAVPPLVYDARPTTTAAPITVDWQYNAPVFSEYVTYVGGLGADALQVSARKIDTAANFYANSLKLNAVTIGYLGGFGAGSMQVTTRTIDSIQQYSAPGCVSAQTVNFVGNSGVYLGLYARNEGGRRGTINSIQNVSGDMHIRDYDIQYMDGFNLNARIENSTISRLGANAAGTITLVNTTVISSGFYGKIICLGSSSILQKDQWSSSCSAQ